MGGISSSVLITGGLGYLGGRIATHLMRSAPQMSLRLLIRSSRQLVPVWAKDLDLARADLLDQASLAPTLEGIDTVIHLAALNEIECQRDPDLALDVNGKGTYRLLQACLHHPG